jgi:hypothetical protein
MTETGQEIELSGIFPVLKVLGVHPSLEGLEPNASSLIAEGALFCCPAFDVEQVKSPWLVLASRRICN